MKVKIMKRHDVSHSFGYPYTCVWLTLYTGIVQAVLEPISPLTNAATFCHLYFI